MKRQMTTSTEKLADVNFRNWVKSQLAILFTKDGLVDVVASQFYQFQHMILKDIYDRFSVPAGTLCTSCTTPDIVPFGTRNVNTNQEGNKPFRKCPNNICNHIKDYIEMEHLYGSPFWKHTDATKWCTDEIEILKCFLPPIGYASVVQFQSLDLNGILAVLTSFEWAGLNGISFLKKARDAVRVIRHSPDLSMSDSDVNEFLGVLINLLTEVNSRVPQDNLVKAKENISELQSGALPLAIPDIRRVLDDCINQLNIDVPKEIKHNSGDAIVDHSKGHHKNKGEHNMQDLHKSFLEEQNQHHRELTERIREAFEINTREMYAVAEDCRRELVMKTAHLYEYDLQTTQSSIKKHRETHYEEGEDFNETHKSLINAKIEIEKYGQQEREKIAQFTQHHIEMIKSQQLILKDWDKRKPLQSTHSENSNNTSFQIQEDCLEYVVERERETDILENIYGKVPVTVLLETAKCNLPFDAYISQEDLENVLSNSKQQCFSSVLSMKERGILDKSNQRSVSAEVSPSRMEKHQGTSIEDGIICIVCKDRKKSSIILPCRHYITCLECLGKQTVCPVCRGPIENVYVYQDVEDEQKWLDTHPDEKRYVEYAEEGGEYDVEGEQILLDTHPDEKRYVDHAEEGEEYDVEGEQKSFDTQPDEKSYVDHPEDGGGYDTNLQRRYLKKHTVRSMKKGELPDQKILNEFCVEFGRKSKFLAYLCQSISGHIKALDENILHVWAAYTVEDRNKITFVVVIKGNVRLEKKIEYSFVKRVVNEYSLEAEQVMYSKEEFPIDPDDLQRLKTSISNHAPALMRRHKYLSIISGSSVRSRNYGLDQANLINLVEEPCVVLYVHTKHFIPLDEEPFEKFYDGVPVDVREGEFTPYVLATDYHDTLKHSCQIGSSPDRSPNDHNRLAGSLGCFVDHPEYNLCGLTCAHVLLFPWGLEQVKRDENGTLRWPSFKPHDIVYQPAGPNGPIGQIVQVIYQEGGNKTCGLEVALFQIDQRQPIAGHFPTMRNAEGSDKMVFDSGKSCGFSHIGDDEAFKFGPVTDKTTGRFELVTHTTCVKTISEYWNYEQFRITLCNQLCVKSLIVDSNGKPIPFAAEGDSGSLVFIKDSFGELISVGIVEGGTTYGATIVTPIKPILQKLGVHSIKSFEKEKVEKKLDNIENRLKDVQSTIEIKMQRNLNDFKTTLFTEMSNYLDKKFGGNK